MAFQVAPLQLPQPVRPVQFDPTAALNQIGDAFANSRRKQDVAAALTAATDAQGNVDFNKAGSALYRAGAFDEARQMLGLSMQQQAAQRAQASLTESMRHNKATEDITRERMQYERATSPFMPTPEGGLTFRPGSTADPAYQEKLRAAQDKTIEAQISEREKAVRARGLDVNEPGLRQYILSGKLPREDQQPLTATDKKAIMEADEGVLSANSAIDALRRAKELSKEAYFGPTAGARGYVTSLFGSKAGEATENLENEVTSNALGQLKAIFGGNPTEGERKIMLDMQGSTKKAPAVRDEIYNRAILAAQNRLQLNQARANELRGGTFYKQKTPEPSPGPKAEAGPGEPSENAVMRAKANPTATLAEARRIVTADPSKAAQVKALLQRAGLDPAKAGIE